MSRKLKIALVYPRLKIPTGDPPLGVAYLASHLRKMTDSETEIFVIDSTFHPSLNYIFDRLTAIQPDLVGIYADTMMYADAVKIARKSRQLEAQVVIGGPHPTVMPETVTAEADAVVIGEGENTLASIVNKFPVRDWRAISGIAYQKDGQLEKTPPARFVENLDQLDFPALDLLEMDKYLDLWHYLDCLDLKIKGTSILTSRGCPFQCSYCQPALSKIFGQKLRRRSPENVVEEMRYLKDRYKLGAVFFHDDTFTVDKSWVEKICRLSEKENSDLLWVCNTRADTIDELMMKKMYAAGLRKCHLGAESGSQRVLDEIYHKQIKVEQIKSVSAAAQRQKIKILCFFMLGGPGETVKEIKQTIKLAVSLPIQEATFSLTTPLPHTYLYDKIAASGEYQISQNFADYNYYAHRVFESKHLSSRRVKCFQLQALMKFYLHPRRWGYISKHLFSFTGFKKLLRKVKRSI
ncbi:MAG: radical SAM protein [Elusimicrobiota bacterium]